MYVRAHRIMPEQLQPGGFIISPLMLLPGTQAISFHSSDCADVHILNESHHCREGIYTFTVVCLIENPRY